MEAQARRERSVGLAHVAPDIPAALLRSTFGEEIWEELVIALQGGPETPGRIVAIEQEAKRRFGEGTPIDAPLGYQAEIDRQINRCSRGL